MKRSLGIVLTSAVVALAPAVLYAADDPKPNTLTAKEIADGWILLFDGETPFGWTATYGADSPVDKLTVDKGALLLRHKEDLLARTTSEFCCFELSFLYSYSGKGVQLVLDAQKQELPESGKDKWIHATIRSQLRGQDWFVTLALVPVGDKPLGIRDHTSKDGIVRTAIGFSVPAGREFQLRDVKLKPINMNSLFNGKNLDGWNIVPGQKSKFSVTEKGELNIKDGGGEIKTDGQWADFVFQLDVFSNGKCLNSGIFFRALPGPDEFWQGYEAQIRNEWDGYSNNKDVAEKKEDRTKPHDIGTGGIYNRQATRKVVTNDKEWFTYTVLAHGNHIALWVNGYQTADYFDKDKDAKTARKGRYLGKGAISLQGHDPTTDLSFRNIRLQELPAKQKAEPKP